MCPAAAARTQGHLLSWHLRAGLLVIWLLLVSAALLSWLLLESLLFLLPSRLGACAVVVVMLPSLPPESPLSRLTWPTLKFTLNHPLGRLSI